MKHIQFPNGHEYTRLFAIPCFEVMSHLENEIMRINKIMVVETKRTKVLRLFTHTVIV